MSRSTFVQMSWRYNNSTALTKIRNKMGGGGTGACGRRHYAITTPIATPSISTYMAKHENCGGNEIKERRQDMPTWVTRVCEVMRPLPSENEKNIRLMCCWRLNVLKHTTPRGKLVVDALLVLFLHSVRKWEINFHDFCTSVAAGQTRNVISKHIYTWSMNQKIKNKIENFSFFEICKFFNKSRR